MAFSPNCKFNTDGNVLISLPKPSTPTAITPRKNVTKHKTRKQDVKLEKGMCVFVPDEVDVWVPGVVTQVKHDVISVTLEPTNQEVEVRSEEAVLRDEKCDYSAAEDLTKISPLSTAAVLQCLKERFKRRIVYTSAGATLVAVNPFRAIPGLYGEETIHGVHEGTSQVAAHIYQVSENSYRRMQIDGACSNQSIIVSGESGSGKTVSAKHLMKYIVTVSNTTQDKSFSEVGARIEQKILDSNPVLEAFGNAATLRNHNSSRFGKYIELEFNRQSEIEGATIQTYLLEKTRVIHQADREFNFHIFYQLLEGLNLESRVRLGLQDKSVFRIAGNNWHCRDRDIDVQSWGLTQKALSELGLTSCQQFSVLTVLAALLHLGNVSFVEDEEDEDIICINSSAEMTSTHSMLEAHLGVDLGDLEKVLTHRRITALHSRRKSVFSKPCPLPETTSRRDCLAKLLYARLFEWLVDIINKSIQSRNPWRTIGILDIYGFESFDINSLEQLCINYANERLQQHYVSLYLKELQADYESEAVAWEHTDFTDNRPCLDLLDANPGIFSLLNEECQLNRDTHDAELQERLIATLRHNAHMGPRRAKHPHFIVYHYAAPVSYLITGLLDKNKDNVPPELIDLLRHSRNEFISSLFTDQELEQGNGKKKKTVLSKFKVSLDTLMLTLSQTQSHYVRCIKPNTVSSAGRFDALYVHQQLEACGVVETVEISRRGYPTRIPYEQFLQQYGLLLSGDGHSGSVTLGNDLDIEGENKENELLFEPLDLLYKKQLKMTPKRKSTTPKRRLRRRADEVVVLPGLSSGDHTRKLCAAILRVVLGPQYTEDTKASCSQFGKTKLFLKEGQLEKLEAARLQVLSLNACRIQRAWRRYAQRQVCRRHRAASVIQAAVRCWLVRREYLLKRHSACVIQAVIRRWLVTLRLRDLQNDIELQGQAGPDHTDKVEEVISVSQSTPLGCSNAESPPGVRLLNRVPDPFSPDVSTGGNYTVSTEVDPEGKTVYHIAHSPAQTPGGKSASEAFRTVAAAVSASFLTQSRFQLAGAFKGIPYLEAQGGVVSRRRMPRVQIKFHTRPNPVLKYGHLISRQEFQCSLADCLQD